VLLITRWKVTEEDCAKLNSYRHIRLSVLVTYSGIDDEHIEPVNSEIAAASLQTLFLNAQRYRTIFYWRPIVPGLNDSDEHLKRAVAIGKHAHATVFSGLFYRDEIAAYYVNKGFNLPYAETARRKILPEVAEARILGALAAMGGIGPLFRKTSCAVGFVHECSDYNGHFGIRELCDICPKVQVTRCASSWRAPLLEEVTSLAADLQADGPPEMTDRAIVVRGLDEASRYFMQHRFGYQVHDDGKPHHYKRHGRADIQYPSNIEAGANR